MKRILAFILCLALVLALTGCGSIHYRAGNYEKALTLFEKQGNTEYVNKCRLMLLCEYILERGDVNQYGAYVLYNSYLSNTGGISLFANPAKPGHLEVMFYIQETIGGSLLSYDISLYLTVDDPVSTVVISREKAFESGNTIITDCKGTVDISTYTAGAALELTESAQNVTSSTVSTSQEEISNAVRQEMFTYFSIAVDSLHEFLGELDMGTTVQNLGFTAWEYE